MRWEDYNFVLGIEKTAEILDRSVSSIHEDLANGCMVPEPLPVLSGPRKHLRRQWSRDALKAYLEGGYLRFQQQAMKLHRSAKPRAGKPRHFFGGARAAVVSR